MYMQKQWSGTQKKILLAVDIPRGNIQSPRAVENMFAYLAGTHGTINLIEKYKKGKFQLSFSYEIVSIEGYTQFLIRTPEHFRDLIETSIYSQYPDAEITEVNDYAEGMPTKFPDEEWDIWGTEFMQAKSAAYPIKLYEEFEHQMGELEATYRDPMAALMDLCSSLRKGEQIWFQIIVKPIDMNDWLEIGDKEVAKILKEKVDTGKNIMDKIGDSFVEWIGDFSEFIYRLWGDIEIKQEKTEDVLKMMNLKPKEKKQVEAIHHKIGKIGFETKIRYVYIARKEVMNKPKAANGFVGFMKQFAAMDSNNLKPDMKVTATTVSYFFKERRLNARKNKIIKNYIDRDGTAGRKMGILNTEELATIWHFPVEAAVKAPLIQKAPGRKAEPPMGLPVGEETAGEELKRPTFGEEKNIFIEEKGEPPKNLPFI